MRLPDNRFTNILLFLMFICGVVMVILPMISQQQEIAADDNLYAMLAQEMQAAVITPEPTEVPENSETKVPEAQEENTEDPAEAPDQPVLSESNESETIPAEDPLLNSEAEIIILQPTVAMICSAYCIGKAKKWQAMMIQVREETCGLPFPDVIGIRTVVQDIVVVVEFADDAHGSGKAVLVVLFILRAVSTPHACGRGELLSAVFAEEVPVRDA